MQYCHAIKNDKILFVCVSPARSLKDFTQRFDRLVNGLE